MGTSMADVVAKPVDYLWHGRIVVGAINVLAGRPGRGKTFVAMDAIARVTTGTDWPDGTPCKPGSAILLNAEDSNSHVLRPRLEAAGAYLRKVFFPPMDAGRMLTMTDIARIRDMVAEVKDCRLIVIDPFGSYFPTKRDSYKDTDTRAVLAPLSALAEELGVAVVIVAHYGKPSTKGGERLADDAVLGSTGIVGISRSVLHVARDKRTGTSYLAAGKHNYGPAAATLTFTIGGNPATLQWTGTAVDVDADDAIAAESRRGPAADKAQAAADWLKDYMADGKERPADEVKAAGRAAGHADRTIERAAKQLVTSTQAGQGRTWNLRQV